MQLLENKHTNRMNEVEYCTYQVLKAAFPKMTVMREKYVVMSDSGKYTIPDFFCWSSDPYTIILEVSGLSINDPRIWEKDQSMYGHKVNKASQMAILSEFSSSYPQYQPLFWFGESYSSPGSLMELVKIFSWLSSGQISHEDAQNRADNVAFSGEWHHFSNINWNILYLGVQELIQMQAMDS